MAKKNGPHRFRSSRKTASGTSTPKKANRKFSSAVSERTNYAITVCRGYVSAQQEYASEIHDNSGVNQYAQKIISTPGKQDGLFWKNADGTPDGPIGEAVASALEEGYTTGKGGFHGYYFKILKGQGPDAPNGAIDYVIEGVMIGGFALVAVPAEYRVTGVKTFIVNYDGIVYQKDLGPNSLEIVKKMELYNPDKTWQRTDDESATSGGISCAVTRERQHVDGPLRCSLRAAGA